MVMVSMEVEFGAGTAIADAVAEAKRRAIMWEVSFIKFNFNGISMSIGPGANVKNACDAFSEALRGEDALKFVVENGR